jgi:two-component system, cell cycle sensor histidine kinase and response regulator CckA
MSSGSVREAEERLRQQNQYLAALHDITLGLIENLDLERLLEAIMQRAGELAGTTHGFVDIVDPAMGAMQLRAATGNFREHMGVWTYPNEGASGRVLASGATALTEDYSQFPTKLPGYEWLHTLVCVPMLSSDTVLGVIGVGFTETVEIQPEQLAFLNQFAQLASLALNNAQIYGGVQKELTERRRIEEDYRELQDALAERVIERTARLTTTLEELQDQVAERERAEEALRASEERFRLLVENAPVGILSMDCDGFLLSANPAARLMLGDALNGHMPNLLTKTHIGDDLRQCLQSEMPVISEHYSQDAHGKDTYHRYHITLIRSGGEVIGLQVLFEDITERKLAERSQHLEVQRLHELNQLKDDFIDSVSHELRTPITNLKVYHHLLGRIPENGEFYLQSLRDETVRLENVVESILYVSEVKDELQNREMGSIDLVEIADYLTQMYSTRAASKGLKLTLHAPKHLRVMGDTTLLKRVMSILLDNSLIYTPADGVIEVRLGSEVSEDQPWVGFSVSNTGPAIPPDELPHVFDRFFRGKAALDTRKPGAGVGLAIARDIIETHRGRITASNVDEPIHQTVFQVWLPALSEGDLRRLHHPLYQGLSNK